MPFRLTEKNQILSCYTDINYNDGLFGSDHDWSHATFGITSGLTFGKITVAPTLEYYLVMDKSVNPDNELRGILSVSVRF